MSKRTLLLVVTVQTAAVLLAVFAFKDQEVLRWLALFVAVFVGWLALRIALYRARTQPPQEDPGRR